MTPGGNLFSIAARAIVLQAVGHEAFLGSIEGDDGLLTDSYAPPITIRASVQAVPRSKYEELGLDLQRSYVTVYTSALVSDLGRGRVGDKLTYAGRAYRVVSATSWLAQDGWQELLCQDIGP